MEKSKHEAVSHSDTASSKAPKAAVEDEPKPKEPSKVKRESNPRSTSTQGVEKLVVK